ncbi:hypothetical protein [Streptomyces tauricus]|uniref:hypothetical protein n=1 Tax=Streptomyces tauricus TaxID=68274 RepID=UPI002242EFD7|nr:hypothetical protein [Streptomyces tauricus]MCW8095839.1 hypothetical protein [Streptomyces tauricus]
MTIDEGQTHSDITTAMSERISDQLSDEQFCVRDQLWSLPAAQAGTHDAAHPLRPKLIHGSYGTASRLMAASEDHLKADTWEEKEAGA